MFVYLTSVRLLGDILRFSLTIKALNKVVADDILNLLCIIFLEIVRLGIHLYSHGMPSYFL